MIISSLDKPIIQEVMNYVSSIINKKIRTKKIKVWALENFWEHELIPSVSKYLFEDIKINENIAPKGNPNRPGDKLEKIYITAHDTDDFTFNAKQWSKHVYDGKIGNSVYSASFQFIIIFLMMKLPIMQVMDDLSSLFKEYDTGVKGNKKKSYISISGDGYYVIEGQKSKIKAPIDTKGNILNGKYFNDMGIYTTVKNGMYYIGSTWYSTTYNKIGNHGGNTNSIGIESCVNKGSDIYLTW